MTHFYLTLPSNSSQQFFPDNTLTEFTTKLSSTIELTNEWEVGLAEIMFPRSWYNIPKRGLNIEIDYGQCYDNTYDVTPLESINCILRIHLKGGFYNSMEQLVQELNQSTIKTFTTLRPTTDHLITPPVFYYKDITRRINIALPPGMNMKFPPLLESILGLSPSQNPLYNESKETINIKGNMSCDMQAGIHALYVYCDLLQFTHVGDIKAPLLRVVNSKGEAGDVVTRYYERPRYVPLQKKNFDSIHIIIRDDLGKKILFENGKLLLTLHFRRTQNQYLI